jgi:hypothetical protein
MVSRLERDCLHLLMTTYPVISDDLLMYIANMTRSEEFSFCTDFCFCFAIKTSYQKIQLLGFIMVVSDSVKVNEKSCALDAYSPLEASRCLCVSPRIRSLCVMEVCCKLCAPAASPPAKYTPVRIEEEAEWAVEGVWTLSRVATVQTPAFFCFSVLQSNHCLEFSFLKSCTKLLFGTAYIDHKRHL